MRSMPLSPAYQPFLSEYGLSCETVRGARVHLYRTGETILRQGCAMDSLYLLVSGTARVSVSSSDGKNLIFCSEVSSGMLGDVELALGERSASTTVVVASPLCCVVLPFSANEDALKANLRFMERLSRELAQKLQNRGHAHMASALLSSEERLCGYLLFTAQDGMFHEPMTEAAQAIGVSYRHVFRLINVLCQDGILEKTPDGLRILDTDALREKSGRLG